MVTAVELLVGNPIPVMAPAPGERFQRFVGDQMRFALRLEPSGAPVAGWHARLRTNLGRADMLRHEIIQAHTHGLPLAGASWRDLPMRANDRGWSLELPLAEAGFFKCKAYLIDPKGWQHWPAGPDVGIAVHPDRYRTGNTLYCAFTRMFGATRTAARAIDESRENVFAPWDNAGYTVIPPSGKLRDLIQYLPHVLDTLGCRILHLLPVNPTPTTYARFGRFGSPYAALDLTAVDPALVVFDRRTTGIDQFRELTYATHLRGGRVFLDIVINHTGWGSTLQEEHPEWFLRNPDGTFASPGAWGNTWEDLVELKHQNVALWDELAGVFLTWCQRGVDGFRCDAGYMVPMPAWQYIVARVQQEYPETIFLLEGLGGAWEATEALLTDGGMQWAYSELFQNYSGGEVATYLDHSLRQSERVGLLVHYSETHDNPRLAARGRSWSLLRNRLCALASVSGGFGFTGGVEWLATEKIKVHDSAGMAWGAAHNLLPELARLNKLLASHPAFFDGAKLTRLSPADSPIFALLRESTEGVDTVLVLVNNDTEREQGIALDEKLLHAAGELRFDLLGQLLPRIRTSSRKIHFTLAPGAAFCLASAAEPRGLSGDAYRAARARAAWGLHALSTVVPVEKTHTFDWRSLSALVERSPARFLAAISRFNGGNLQTGLNELLDQSEAGEFYPSVICWTPADVRRVTPVPPGHWLLVEDSVPFRATLDCDQTGPPQNVESISVSGSHVACFAPVMTAAEAALLVERYGPGERHLRAAIHFLPPLPEPGAAGRLPRADDIVLLTNGIGGMARMCVDLGRVKSKYDCVLGANLHPEFPVDRHVFVKRIRLWVNADGFISPLDIRSLAAFESGPPAVWHFVANAGDGRTVEIEVRADMLETRNTVVFHFHRPGAAQATGKQLPPDADVRLTVRPDIEDRSFHSETQRNGGADFHFAAHTRPLDQLEAQVSASGGRAGFAFTPAPERQLRVYSTAGFYHSQPEWSENIPHPIEQTRGQVGSGDAYSPGWFELPLPKGASAALVVTADAGDPAADEIESSRFRVRTPRSTAAFANDDAFGQQLLRAARAFLVRRGTGKTVIAGYPWFLDWGRDTFICARGLLAAGLIEEVRQIVMTFARFEQDGTLPNTIFGSDASNRDTSDAPLWFGVVCEELARCAPTGTELYSTRVDDAGRTIRDVLWSIAVNYAKGTPNGIRMDPESALVWSPSHFTWMDTNYPAATPREGYPVSIQALWIRLLRQLERIGGRTERKGWDELADKALASVERLYWLEERGWYSDLLIAPSGQSAANAVADDALRCNFLFAISLVLMTGERAKRSVAAATRHLVIPGALRTLAPLPVRVPLPVRGRHGELLNNPSEPYWGRYEGDEDTRRKPAYHNGTAWTWTFPTFCEALAIAWGNAPEAVAAARAYLASMSGLMSEGCLGHLPEIVDGDVPHGQRGCDAQSWSATEALRVWKALKSSPKP